MTDRERFDAWRADNVEIAAWLIEKVAKTPELEGVRLRESDGEFLEIPRNDFMRFARQ